MVEIYATLTLLMTKLAIRFFFLPTSTTSNKLKVYILYYYNPK